MRRNSVNVRSIKVKYPNGPTRGVKITNNALIADPMAPRTTALTNVISPSYRTYDTNDSLSKAVVELFDFGTNKEGDESKMAPSCDSGRPV
eukprot:CAMPEP_0201878626 /NCGR_PEP_ID=MMETSP0902-20130614/9745_1 /ASSEMBLY_ACC=CAM_ASM_000551 /TAXON_ID=420261 /ORGANISM="Thalassiosira antarctica, Strain CCMP982" /LENGTH=90 /DNA_ID=CAMNT_0048406303 /DNA_START=347 /DNA_END=619 /DNA_ORIENTATION=+